MDSLSGGFYAGGLPSVGGGYPGKKAMMGMEKNGKGGGGPSGVVYAPSGFSPEGQQNNTSNDQLLAMASSQINNGQTLTPAVSQGVNQAYGNASVAQTNLNTPQSRQGFLNDTNLNAAQGNYDQLAKQLAAYDNMVLQPQFAGTNPGTPSDVPQNPFANNTPAGLSYLTPQNAALPYQQGIYNANPTYALTSQNNQRNSIVDVLDTLNSVIANENKRGIKQHTSQLQSVSDILGQLGKIMEQNTSLTEKKAELALSQNDKNNAKYSDLTSLADKLKSDLATGISVWGDAWNTVKSYADRMGISVSPQEIDTLLGGKYDTSDPTGEKGLTTGWAVPGAAQEYASGLRYKQTAAGDAKQQAMAKVGVNVINSLDQVPNNVMNSTGGPTALSAYAKVSRNFFGIPLTGTLTKDEQEQANLQAKYFALVQSALTAIQGSRPSDYDVKSYQQQLGPSIANPPQVNQDRINNLISLMGIEGQITFGNGKINGSGGGTVLMTGPDGKQWNVPNDKVEVFKQNGYK